MLDKMLTDLEGRVFGELCDRRFLAPEDGVVREVCERLVVLGIARKERNPLGGEDRYVPSPDWHPDAPNEPNELDNA